MRYSVSSWAAIGKISPTNAVCHTTFATVMGRKEIVARESEWTNISMKTW